MSKGHVWVYETGSSAGFARASSGGRFGRGAQPPSEGKDMILDRPSRAAKEKAAKSQTGF